MKFSIEYTSNIEPRKIIYHIDEWSFDTEPTVQEINFDIVLNKINLTAIGADNRIAQVWGFCGLDKKMKSSYEVPERRKGILKVLEDLPSGVGSFSINKRNVPVYVNTQTGWVCVGDPEGKGNAVEFINNCVAVIDEDKEFVSLWLKPETLPHI